LDALVDVEGAFDFFEQSPSKDKTLLYYEYAMHDMAHEIEIHEYLGILVKWIEDRI
jgi:alpha-beta hydrolase superfamily lysophospholipase